MDVNEQYSNKMTFIPKLPVISQSAPWARYPCKRAQIIQKGTIYEMHKTEVSCAHEINKEMFCSVSKGL